MNSFSNIRPNTICRAPLVHISTEVSPLIERADYAGALRQLSALSVPVDQFFDDVMVMAENPTLRNNRPFASEPTGNPVSGNCRYLCSADV
ncbi:MAG: hypothetical protein Ct9H300mP14_09340 [Gammaproteobacteria bacterium]|nr:MAG: hypothetical protein Ct9H300mP14_09340 [Gammaproteobacteria bacterium]